MEEGKKYDYKKEEYIEKIVSQLSALSRLELRRIFLFCYFLNFFPKDITFKNFWIKTDDLEKSIEREIKNNNLFI